MGNCLVTKLKGTVDNQNLLRYGETRFKILEEETFSGKWLRVQSSDGAPITIEAHGEGSFTVGDDPAVKTTFTTSGTSTYDIKFSNGTYDVSLLGKYSLKSWGQQVAAGHNSSQIEFNIEDLKYSPIIGVTAANNKAIYGNIDVLDKSLISTLAVAGCSNLEGSWTGLASGAVLQMKGSGVGGSLADYPEWLTEIDITDNLAAHGTLDDFAGRTNLTKITMIRAYNITGGKLESLGENTNLSVITLSELRDYSGFDGSVEAFVEAQIAAGRTSCSTSSPIGCPWLLYAATFGGQKYSRGGYMYLTWDSASKITIYNGAQQIANCTYIYAKGATQEEIAAWEQAGKTVTIIS